jgi:hypothetical protein
MTVGILHLLLEQWRPITGDTGRYAAFLEPLDPFLNTPSQWDVEAY